MKTAASIVLIALAASLAFAANEIQSVINLKVTKGSLDVTRSVSQQLTLSAAKPNAAGFTQSIPTNTAGTAITLGDVAINGVAWFRNLDTTNYVEIGIQESGVFYPLVRLNYGEAWSFRLAQGVAPYARANATNNVNVVLEKLIFDN